LVQTSSVEGRGGLWCRARSASIQQGSGEGCGKDLGGFSAEPGQGFIENSRSQVQQGSGEGSREGMVQSQVRFNRVPEKVPEKVWGALVQSQVRFNRFRRKYR